MVISVHVSLVGEDSRSSRSMSTCSRISSRTTITFHTFQSTCSRIAHVIASNLLWGGRCECACGKRVVVSLSLASVHISVCLQHCVNVVFFPSRFNSASSVPPATSVRSLDLCSPSAVPPDEHTPLATGSDVCLVSVCVCVCVYVCV